MIKATYWTKMMSPGIKVIKTVLPLFLGVYLIWIFFMGMSEESLAYFYRAIRKANYFWIVFALFLTFIAYLSRAYRWRYALEPLGYRTKFWNRYHALMIGYLVNMTIPRAGEASRAAMLYRSDGVPFSKSFGTIIAERAVDLLLLGTIALITLFLAADNFHLILDQIQARFSPDQSQSTGLSLGKIILLILGVGALAFSILLYFKKNWRAKVVSFIKEVLAGVLSLLKSANPLAYLGHSLLIWCLYLTYFGIAFFSMAETQNLSMEAILMGFLAGSLGIMFTNGGIGTFPLLVGMVVVFYLGKDEPNALAIGNAIGMLIWVSQTIFLILLGLISLALLPKNYSKKDVETELRTK